MQKITLEKKQVRASQETQLQKLEARFEKLTNAMLDELVDTEVYLKQKEKYLKDKQRLSEQLQSCQDNEIENFIQMVKMFELPQTLSYAYFKGNEHEKRSLLKKTSSNFMLNGGRLILEPKYPLGLLLNNQTVHSGGPFSTTTRRFCPRAEKHTICGKDYNPEHPLKVD